MERYTGSRTGEEDLLRLLMRYVLGEEIKISDEMADVFKLLSNRNVLEIFKSFSNTDNGCMHIHDLAKSINTSVANLRYLLKRLVDLGLVEKAGRTSYILSKKGLKVLTILRISSFLLS